MFYNQHFWGECVWRGSCVVFAYFHGVNHPAMACYRIPVWSLTTELSKRLMVDSCQVGWQRLPTPLHRRPTESESSHQQILRAVHMFEKHGSRPLLCTALMCSLQWGVGPGLVSCCPFIAHHAETYRTGIWLALLGQSTDAIGPWSLVLLSGAECKGNCFGRWSVNRKILSRALWGRLGRVGKTSSPHRYAGLLLTQQSMSIAKHLGSRLRIFCFLCFCIYHFAVPECVCPVRTVDRKHGNWEGLYFAELYMPFLWNSNWKQTRFFLFCMKKREIYLRTYFIGYELRIYIYKNIYKNIYIYFLNSYYSKIIYI